MTLRKFIAALVLAAPLAACAGNTPTEEPSNDATPEEKELLMAATEAPETEIKAVYAQMQSLTTDMACVIDADCAVVAVGHRACGGPSHYMPYSNKIGDESVAEIQALAQRSTLLARQINEKSDMMSTCEVISPPQAACIENRCAMVERDKGLLVR